MTDFNEIRKKIELLKRYDSSFAAFGSKTHEYIINPVLSESDIAKFEKIEQVNLPKSYRDYLKYLGDGGAGPNYGIYSLQDARNGAGWYLPIKDLNNKENDDDSPGELLISHNGCGLFTWLKVSGPSAGEVWYDGRANDEDSRLINNNFLEWYKNWLDSIFFETGFIAYLGKEAFELGKKRLFKEAIELFKLGISIECRQHYTIRPEVKTIYLQILCNSLYFIQNDNTGLPVDVELNQFFLAKCLPYGKENPAIYFNAACVYNEMKDFINVTKCIQLAKQYYNDYEMMIETIKKEPIFAEFRKDHPTFFNL